MTATPRPCAKCGKPIPAERTDLLPDTRLCVDCSSDSGGEFDLVLTAENLSKSGSMKKNYSSFGVEKRRRDITKN